MKSFAFIALAALVMTSCDKPEAKPEPTAKAAAAPKKEAPLAKKMPPVPQGKLPTLDPEKAKFIAVPSTPKDPEPKKADQPKDEVKKAEKPATEAKK